MSRTWSPKSQQVYDTLDPRLQVLVTRIRDEVCDISLLDGYRDKATQDKYVRKGTSEIEWPHGKHNKFPSLAVDLVPYPRPRTEEKLWGALGYVAGRAHSIAQEEGFAVRWGGDWDRDGDLTDQKFDDLFHLEIVS